MATIEHQRTDIVRERVRAALGRRLQDHVSRLRWSQEELAAHQRERLRALLAHASESSPFHARRLQGVDAAAFELEDLGHLPTMTKAQVMGHLDDVLTDPRLGADLVEAHLEDSVRQRGLLFDEYICLASGGSSGARGVFVQTVDEYADFVASLMRARFAAMDPGGPTADGLVIALVAAASPVHSSGFGAATSGGLVRLVSVPATLQLPTMVEQLNELQPPLLMGYPTKLAQLAREQLAGRLHIAPGSVTTTSELLTPEDRSVLRQAFCAPIIDQFVSTEGLVGQTEPDGSIFTFATDMCLVELVDDDNRPVGPGAVAAKALITNLHNLTQPLIRYELTDRFVAHNPKRGHLRAGVEGRADAVFRYGDVEVHPLVIRSVLVNVPAITEYQVQQTHSGVHVDAVFKTGLDTGSLASALANALRSAGLGGARASVNAVDAIPRDLRTGKVARFVPLRGAAGPQVPRA